MKAILIDPIDCTLHEVQFNGNYKQIYDFLSDTQHGLEVDDFNEVQIDDRNCFYVDGEGLLKNPRYFFEWRGAPQPYAGRGLILGYNREGESVATTWTVERARPHIRFRQYSVQGFVHEEGKENHPLLGPDTFFIRETPVFGPPNNDEEK